MPTLLQRFARVSPYMKTGRLGLLAAALGSLVGAATEPLIPALMKPLFDRGFKAGELALWWVPVVIIGLFMVRGLAGFVAQYGLSWAANKAVLQMRREMFDRLMTAKPALFAKNTTTSLLNTLVYETQAGTMQLVGALLTVVKDSLTLIALLGYLLWLNWQLTLFVAILFPSVALVMRALGKRLHRLTVDGQKATDELGYIVEENVLAWRIVRLHGAAKIQSARFFQRGDLLRRLVMKSVVASATMTPVTQIMAACTLSAVVVLALWQSTTSGGSVGSFVAFITAMLMIIAPIKHLSDVMAPITRGLAAVERGLDLIDASPVEEGGSHDGGRARGEIELREVTVRYRDDPDAALALDQVSLRVRAGESVALVGPSGAGKSTLVHLLPRFIEPTSGEILLDGVPIRDWDVRALRRQFALVSQDVVLFNDTVAANVALGIGNGDAAEREKVKDALRAANLLEFAESLPMGIDTPIGHNGNQLSGGQRQRLAIARAIYKDAPVLILDEATSALDSESERAVQAALERLMIGRTSLVIAHRLSTIETADRVVALDAGRLVEQGSHAELLAAGGLYARLHAMQFRT